MDGNKTEVNRSATIWLVYTNTMQKLVSFIILSVPVIFVE